MIINIILVILLIYLIYIYKQRNDQTYKKTETFDDIPANMTDIYRVRPYINNNELKKDLDQATATSNVHELDYPQMADKNERDRNEKFRNRFFDFRNKINNTSHLNDPVDNINMTNNAQTFANGESIGDIYDKLVNSYDYKTKNLPDCYEKRQMF